jgi:hypothetical protein
MTSKVNATFSWDGVSPRDGDDVTAITARLQNILLTHRKRVLITPLSTSIFGIMTRDLQLGNHIPNGAACVRGNVSGN